MRSLTVVPNPAAAIRGCDAAADAASHVMDMTEKICEGPKSFSRWGKPQEPLLYLLAVAPGVLGSIDRHKLVLVSFFVATPSPCIDL